MQHHAYFEFPQSWTSQDLVDATPLNLRLHQIVDFNALHDGGDARSANAMAQPRYPVQKERYAPLAALPLHFSVR